jgi:hypothetical protein
LELKTKVILGCTIFFLNLIWISTLHPSSGTRFSVVYTNDVMGEVEPCG